MTDNFTTIAPDITIAKTIEALTRNGFHADVVPDKVTALAKIKSLIPLGASVQNGSSVTLEEIGFIAYLKEGTHGWNNLHAAIVAEKDPAKQMPLRQSALFADYYLGSVHALSETGEMIIASNTGSQLPHLVFSSPNVILVVGAQKITSSLSDGFTRLDEYVLPLEDERIMGVYKTHTTHAKTLILHKENPMLGRKVHVIIVKESLGF